MNKYIVIAAITLTTVLITCSAFIFYERAAGTMGKATIRHCQTQRNAFV